MSMSPAEMRDWWNGEAEASAKGAIISNADLSDEAAFFESGRVWIDEFARFAEIARIDLRGETAVDFGCGLGRMTAALADRYAKVTGIDISDEMVRQATERQSDAMEFVQVSEPPWPFESRSVDLTFSTIAVQHIPAPHNVRAVTEMFRISRRLVLFDAPSYILARDEKDLRGIFFLPFGEIMGIAATFDFELMALRDFPTTKTRQYQYLFRLRPAF